MEYDEKVQSGTTENVARNGATHSEAAHNGAAKHPAGAKRGGFFNTLYPPGETGGVGPRLKNHYKRFWWCECLVVIIIVLVVTLPVIFVAIPNKAQHDINASTLTITEQDVTNPTSSSVHLKLVSQANSSSAYHPTLDAFTAALFLESTEPNIKPFMYLNIPKTKAEKSTTINVDQDIQIADMNQFIAYNQLVMGSEEFRIGLRGRVGVHQSGLRKMTANYNKGISMKGLNKLKGFNITDFSILSTPNPDGSNVNGTVFIPNPSVMTLDLGNVTLDFSVAGQAIGTSLLPNLVLKPGDNNVPMSSTVNQTLVINMVLKNYTNGVVPIDILGNSSISNGQHLPYYEAAIQNNPMHINLNVGAALGLNLGGL